jgi:hypothetical protein
MVKIALIALVAIVVAKLVIRLVPGLSGLSSYL